MSSAKRGLLAYANDDGDVIYVFANEPDRVPHGYKPLICPYTNESYPAIVHTTLTFFMAQPLLDSFHVGHSKRAEENIERDIRASYEAYLKHFCK